MDGNHQREAPTCLRSCMRGFWKGRNERRAGRREIKEAVTQSKTTKIANVRVPLPLPCVCVPQVVLAVVALGAFRGEDLLGDDIPQAVSATASLLQITADEVCACACASMSVGECMCVNSVSVTCTPSPHCHHVTSHLPAAHGASQV